MVFIRAVARDLDGNEIAVRYEGPKDEQGRSAVGYLKPSGATYVHPMYAFAKQVGVSLESMRPAHLGIDGKGNEGVSDQRWIYDLAEASQLEQSEPARFVRVES